MSPSAPEEVEILLKEKDIHFLALDETKLDENCKDEILKIEEPAC